MKYITNIGLAAVLAVSCSVNSLNVSKTEPMPKEFKEYTFSDESLPENLLKDYKLLIKIDGYSKSLETYLEDVDKSDYLQDNYISKTSLANYKFERSISELNSLKK